MKDFKEKEYKVFEMFDKQWAIVTSASVFKGRPRTKGSGILCFHAGNLP